MISLIIIAVMIVTLMGAATYGLVGVMRNLQTNIQNLITQDRLEEAAEAVAANIVSVNTATTQVYYVPAPENLSAPTVPSWITPGATTARGTKFLYCAFSNAVGGASTVTTPSGTNYDVTLGTLYTGTNYGSSNYVIASSTRPALASTALAVLVAPGPNASSTLPSALDCLSVTAAGTLTGATVRIITEQEIQSRMQVSASSGAEFYTASSATGDGKGASKSNYALFSTVMDYVNKYRPQRVTINMKPSDTVTVASADMDQSTVATRERSTTRNHSIEFLPATPHVNDGYYTEYDAYSAFSLASSGGVYQPVIFGNVYFLNGYFPAVTGSLFRPAASTFGNVIFNNTGNWGNIPFATAENLGRVIIDQPENIWQDVSLAGIATGGSSGSYDVGLIASPSGTPTNKEFFYTQRGGIFKLGYGMSIQYNVGSYTNYILYNDFGGGAMFDTANSTFTIQQAANNSGISAFYVGPGAVFQAPTSLVDTGDASSETRFSQIFGDIASRTYGGPEGVNPSTLLVYNQGGSYIQTSSVNFKNSMAEMLSAGPGASFDFVNGAGFGLAASGHYPTVGTIYSNSSIVGAGLARLGGGSTPLGTSSSLLGMDSPNYTCLADTTNYSLASDAPVSGGGSTALTPKGNIGMEASILLNRINGTCSH